MHSALCAVAGFGCFIGLALIHDLALAVRDIRNERQEAQHVPHDLS